MSLHLRIAFQPGIAIVRTCPLIHKISFNGTDSSAYVRKRSVRTIFFFILLLNTQKTMFVILSTPAKKNFRGNDDRRMSCMHVCLCCCSERQQTHHSFWHNVSFSLQLFIVVANVIYRNREIIFNPPLPSTDTYPHTVAVFFYNSRKTALFIQKFIA